MIGYETEEQQVQAIKQFWKDNGMVIILGVVIGFGALWGWRAYNDSTINAKEEASAGFNAGIESYIDSESTDALNEFISANADTGYAPLAALIVAKEAADKEDYTAAKEALNAAIGKDAALSDIARIRLADIHLQLTEYDQALSVLSTVEADTFSEQVEELKGDALLAKGDFQGAKSAYAASLEEAPNNTNVKMKLDNIAYAQTQTAITEMSTDSE